MRMAVALIACAVVGLGALVVTIADCGPACSNTACEPSTFTIGGLACIASIQTDCAGSFVEPCKVDGGSGAAAGSYGGAYAPPDGGTCTVTTLLEDGTTITTSVHWVLRTPANECCPATYTADPPSLEIGPSNIDASAD